MLVSGMLPELIDKYVYLFSVNTGRGRSRKVDGGCAGTGMPFRRGFSFRAFNAALSSC